MYGEGQVLGDRNFVLEEVLGGPQEQHSGLEFLEQFGENQRFSEETDLGNLE